MKTFGFRKKQKSKYLTGISRIDILFIFLMLFLYSFFVSVNSYSKIVVADDKLDIFSDSLYDLAIGTWSFDSEISKMFLILQDIKQSYLNGDNVLLEKESEIRILTNYFQNNKNIFKNIGLDKYSGLTDFVAGILDYRDDITTLLGKDGKKQYLIFLQNAGEKRPNGGFYGSYGILTLDGKYFDFEIKDTYYIYQQNNGYIQGPEWMKYVFESDEINFVAGNKYGFTDEDSKNLIKIYENVFPDQQISGTFFINSRMFEDYFPGLKEKIWEWQFVNSSIDLIRGEKLPNKKEIYLDEINSYVKNNLGSLFKQFAINFEKIIDGGYINIYFEGISDSFNDYIIEKNIQTVYNQNMLYSWDLNKGFNKIDRFVRKNIEIKDIDGNILYHSNVDKIKFPNEPGEYYLDIMYNINIPKSYEKLILQLQEKYGIELTQRENKILGLDYNWENQGILYLPKNSRVVDIKGSVFDTKVFNTDFSKNVSYRMKTSKNNSFSMVSVHFKIIN